MDLYYAQYSLKSLTVPPELQASSDIDVCAKMQLPDNPSFEFESSILSRYDDLKSSESKKPAISSKIEESQIHDDLVKDMSGITGLDKSECSFYLESMGWELDKAVEMWEGLRKP